MTDEDIQKLAQSLAILETEVKNMQGATTERIRIWEQKLSDIRSGTDSLHRGVTTLRGQVATMEKQLVAIDGHAAEVKEDANDLKLELKDAKAEMIKEVDGVKEDWSDWIDGIATNFKWIVGSLIIIAGIVIGLVHG